VHTDFVSTGIFYADDDSLEYVFFSLWQQGPVGGWLCCFQTQIHPWACHCTGLHRGTSSDWHNVSYFQTTRHGNI